MAELVFIPAPGVGHLVSTVEIAKLLVNRDQRISITILLIKPPSASATGSSLATYIQSFTRNPTERTRFIQLPQDETPPKHDPKAPMTFFKEFINSHCKYVRNAVSEMMSQPGSSRVAGLVIDMFCTSMIDVANEFGLPTYVFFTSNAAFLGFKLYIQALSDDEKQDVVELSYSDEEIRVPSFVKRVPTKVFPLVVQNKEGLEFVIGSARRLRAAKAIIVNTFLELETHAVQSLCMDRRVPPVYPVGPVVNLKDGGGDIIQWLDGQPPSSVVFLCFGSMGSFAEVQVKEIAHALERSGQRFLWSLRRPIRSEQGPGVPGDYEDPGAVLPEGFLERTVGQGKVIGWAPQVAVLAHGAVGGFVSHCGWNSVLESLWFGVPLAAWPMYAEQQMNAFEMVVELGLAVEMKLDYKKGWDDGEGNMVIVTAEEIGSGIRRVMSDNGVRSKVKEMCEKSRAAVVEGGSSYDSVGRLIQDFVKTVS